MCDKELKNISKWSCYWSNHVSRHLAGRRPLEFKKFKIWTCGSLWGSQSKIYCLDFLWCNFSLLRSLEKMYLIILRSKLKINKSFSPINWSHCCLLDAFYKGTKGLVRDTCEAGGAPSELYFSSKTCCVQPWIYQ